MAKKPEVAESPVAAKESAAPKKPVVADTDEGFRSDAGRFTGNAPTDAERLDAICDVLEANGMSLPKVLQRK